MDNHRDIRMVVNGLCKKALDHRDATEAMKFSQAALNAANAYCSLRSIQLRPYEEGSS